MFYLNLIFIVIAVSLDGFGVGITYGMRKINIPFYALFVIVFCSGIIVLSSMVIGNLLSMFISPQITKIIGSFILILLGGFVLYSILRSSRPQKKSIHESSGIGQFTTILSAPQHADKDKSGSISVSEALVLGTALALDAFGAGLGAAMLGYSAILTATSIAVMSGLFVFSGLKLGFLLSRNKALARLTFLPPIILISIGVYHLF